MCGIVGYLQRGGVDEDGSRAIVAGMTDCISHRGPDDSGAWVDADAGVVFGHRRLSILDLSPLGHQPMISGCGRYMTVFNGEIYNFRELGRELAALGHRFRGSSDTEILLAAVSEWGIRSALDHFNGMFAFAVWDRQERVLHLARDRMGEKPLYYGWMGTTFLFGSELKALRAHPSFRPDLDRNALTLYLRHGYIPAPFSIYAAVRKLPPGTLLSIGSGDTASSAAPEAYWDPRLRAEAGRAEPFRGTEAEAVERLDTLLRDSVEMRMEADVPLGAFLSGGVDSSTVVAMMQSQSSRPVKTFTIGFDESGYNEAEHAKAVARYLGTEHTELYVTPREAMAVIPRLPTLYDEPFADSSQIPTFLVSELASRHVTVSLSGDGGDELFGGYERYPATIRRWKQLGGIPGFLRVAAAQSLTGGSAGLEAAASVLGARANGALGRRMQRAAALLSSSEQQYALYLYLLSAWQNPAAVVRGATEPLTVLSDPGRWPNPDDFMQGMMYLDTVSYLPDDILVKVDRASMGVSLEGRVPLLDHRIVEFAWSVPLAMKVRDGVGKWLLRQVLYRYLPKELMERPKKGFGVPIAEWLRGPLRGWAEELLDEQRLRDGGVFDPQPIRTQWMEHVRGRRNNSAALWNVLMFQAWAEEQRGGGTGITAAPLPAAVAQSG